MTEEQRHPYSLAHYVRWVAGNILIRLADAAGALAFYIRNSDGADVFKVESDGDVTIAGDLTVSGTGPDHGGLAGLADDDHAQYYNAARHTKAVHDALGLDHGALSGKLDDDHAQYLLANGTRVLLANWDIGDTLRIKGDGIRARDGAGLRLEDDAGNLGLFVEDGGDVGIGTTSPDANLDLEDSDGPMIRFSSSASSGDEDMGGLEWYQTTGSPAVVAEIEVVRGTGDYDQGVLLLKVNNGTSLAEAMRIAADGDVGIGHSTPLEKLTVYGLVFLDAQGYDGTYKRSVKFGYVGDADIHHSIQTTVSGGGASDNGLRIYVHGGGTSDNQVLALHLGGDGKVGVGLTGPSAKLDVDGAIAIKDGVSAPSTVSGKAFIYVDSSDGDLKVKFGDGTVKTLATD